MTVIDQMRAEAERMKARAGIMSELALTIGKFQSQLDRLKIAHETATEADGRIVLTLQGDVLGRMVAELAAPETAPRQLPPPLALAEVEPEPPLPSLAEVAALAAAKAAVAAGPLPEPMPEPVPAEPEPPVAVPAEPDPAKFASRRKGDTKKPVTGPLQPSEMEVIHQMLDEGCTGPQIAKRLNRKPNPLGVLLVKIRKDRRAAAAEADAKASRTAVSVPKELPVAREPVNAPPPPPKPVARSTKPAKQPNGQAIPFDENVPFAHRSIAAHLDRVGYAAPWSAALDLALMQGLCSGKAAALVGDELDIEAGVAKARFRELNTRPGNLDHQRDLMTVLRARAGVS